MLRLERRRSRGQSVKSRLAVVVLVGVTALATSASTATSHPGNSGSWLWTPAICKSLLNTYGVEIDDGRTFRALSSRDVFCGGLPYCEYDQSARRYFYDHFAVAMIDGNGVYRTMRMHVVARRNFRVTELRVHGRPQTRAEVTRFRAIARQYIAVRSQATQASCARVP